MAYALKNGKTGTADDKIKELMLEYLRYYETLSLIAAPMRPDGTFNRDREACRRLAEDALYPKVNKD